MNNKEVISTAVLNTIEKDWSNGKFESMTESIIGLNGGLQSIVNIFKTIFPKLDSVSAKDALVKTEDSFQNGYIRDSLYLVGKDNLVNLWYLDPDLNKWIVVEKQRFVDLKKVKLSANKIVIGNGAIYVPEFRLFVPKYVFDEEVGV